MPGRNFDYPRPLRGRMAKNALREMAQKADRLERSLTDDDALPAWIDYYIATSSDRMHTVGNYMEGVLKEFQPSSKAQQNSVYADAAASEPMDLSTAINQAMDKGQDLLATSQGRTLSLLYLASMPLAAFLSYKTDQSAPKAALAGLLSFPYVIYHLVKHEEI